MTDEDESFFFLRLSDTFSSMDSSGRRSSGPLSDVRLPMRQQFFKCLTKFPLNLTSLIVANADGFEFRVIDLGEDLRADFTDLAQRVRIDGDQPLQEHLGSKLHQNEEGVACMSAGDRGPVSHYVIVPIFAERKEVDDNE